MTDKQSSKEESKKHAHLSAIAQVITSVENLFINDHRESESEYLSELGSYAHVLLRCRGWGQDCNEIIQRAYDDVVDAAKNLPIDSDILNFMPVPPPFVPSVVKVPGAKKKMDDFMVHLLLSRLANRLNEETENDICIKEELEEMIQPSVVCASEPEKEWMIPFTEADSEYLKRKKELETWSDRIVDDNINVLLEDTSTISREPLTKSIYCKREQEEGDQKVINQLFI